MGEGADLGAVAPPFLLVTTAEPDGLLRPPIWWAAAAVVQEREEVIAPAVEVGKKLAVVGLAVRRSGQQLIPRPLQVNKHA